MAKIYCVLFTYKHGGRVIQDSIAYADKGEAMDVYNDAKTTPDPRIHKVELVEFIENQTLSEVTL